RHSITHKGEKIMRTIRFWPISAAAAISIISSAHADTLTAQDLSVLAQSTVSDTDAAFLYILGGNDPSASPVPKAILNYSSTGNDTSWSGSLSGTLVNSFLLSYTSSGDTATSNSWTSSGTLSGFGSVSGSGSASITYPTGTTFDVSFSDML